MLLQVDVNYLLKNRITVDQFLVAQLIYEKSYELLGAYLDLYTSEDLKKLILGLVKAGLIENYNYEDQYELSKFIIKPTFVKILAQGDFFDEFIQTYPTSVIRPDGTKDYLRTDLNRCRRIYNKITGNKYAIHLNILQCLQFELALRRKEGKLSYMKRLPKWLGSEEWKIYEQRIKDENFDSLTTTEELGYGNRLE
jgi:hypothetical protein